MILDDNSPEEVGLDIWDMYCDCGEGDTASARKVLESLPTVIYLISFLNEIS